MSSLVVYLTSGNIVTWASLAAMLLPVGLLYLGLRRRKPESV
jgi:hypothetical protein